MSPVNINYKSQQTTKDTDYWNYAENTTERHEKKQKAYVSSIDSKVNLHDSQTTTSPSSTGRNRKWKTEDATQQFDSHQKLDSHGDSKFNLVEENSSKKNSMENENLKTFTHKNQYRACSKEMSSNMEAGSVVSNQDKHDNASHNTSFIEEISEADAALEEKRQQRRERVKLKKEMKKQEKALVREEEMRKKRLAPKDQKITIIDRSTLDRFLEKDSKSHSLEAKKGTNFGSEFPSLGEVISSSRSSPNRNQRKNESKKERSSLTIPSEKKPVSLERRGSSAVSEKRDQSSDTRPSSSQGVRSKFALRSKSQESNEAKPVDDLKKMMKPEDKTGGKRPKRRDPIQLDITEILKVQETKLDVSVKQHPKPTQKVEVVRYAGNILDSDNPERKRGKQREVPKVKKPSSLKQIILQERAKRKEASLEKFTNQINELHTKEDTQPSGIDEIVSVNADTESKFVNDNKNDTSENPTANNLNSLECKGAQNVNWHLHLSPIKLKTKEAKQSEKEEIEQSQCENLVNDEKPNNVDIIKDTGVPEVSNEETNIETAGQIEELALRIHSRKFREYCDHLVTPDILSSATALLEDIVKFHDRQYARSPLKASAKRRHVTGLKEVRRFMTLRRIRLLVIAPDLERTPSPGGLDDIVAQLKESAITNNIPYVFALHRRHLGYILKKKVPVSCVGVLNYDGTEHNFRNLMSAVEQAREAYKLKVGQPLFKLPSPNIENEQIDDVTNVGDDVNKEVVASLLAKLSSPRNIESSSSFLKVIEQCANFDSDEENEDGK